METPMEIFKSEDGNVQVNVIIENETAWLTQSAMAELFGVQKAAVSKHLKNIFESGELQENSVVSKMETTAAELERDLRNLEDDNDDRQGGQ